ncbi:MAG: thiamine-phosphate kinase [Archaeoglobi archaeon]|nr:thiamine-phosphate kinase [Archaeoglobi archaeon]
MTSEERKRVSKFLSGLLRHYPDRFGVEVDRSGFANLNDVLRVLEERYGVGEEHLRAIVSLDGKRRFEICDGKIRARYGHSIDVDVRWSEGNAPRKLYHATAPENLGSIMRHGLLPMRRREVHMTETPEEALEVGLRHSKTPVLLEIDAESMIRDGLEIRKKGRVFTADSVPPRYIRMEEELILAGMAAIRRKSEEFGDDGGAFRLGDVWVVVTNDMLVESTDVVPSMSPEDVGFKVVTMNASDLAAMGAKPGFFAFSAGFREGDAEFAKRLFRGINEGLERYGMNLISADTNSAKELVVDGVAIGFAKNLLRRSMAKPGQLVCVTGELGRPLSALLVELRGFSAAKSVRERLMEKLLRPVARVEEGLRLSEVVSCAIDVSDGLVKELKAISSASGVGIVIDPARVPVCDEVREFCEENGLDVSEVAMNSGEEYELVFTIDREKLGELDFDFAIIGRVVEGKGVWVEEGGKRVEARDLSWRHFSDWFAG